MEGKQSVAFKWPNLVSLCETHEPIDKWSQYDSWVLIDGFFDTLYRNRR